MRGRSIDIVPKHNTSRNGAGAQHIPSVMHARGNVPHDCAIAALK
jgi:hypothetical protein